MTGQEIDDIADRYSDVEMLRMDGYDDCCIGVVERFGMQPILCYSAKKVIARLMADGMTEEEAWEFFHFNQIGAWMGDGTPCFISCATDGF
jgi:hypothetical protein